MSEPEQNWQGLFKTILQADISSKQILPYTIVLLGITRAGKSAAYNWLTDPNSLIGIKLGINYYYVLKDMYNPQVAAKIGHTMISVTQLPNKRKINVENREVMLLDFPGFGERKGAVDVIKVNYCMCSHLLKLQKTKFVIVIPERIYGEISSTGVRDALNQFLNLFKFDLMEEHEKKQLFDSVSLCITSSTEADEKALVQQLDILNNNLRELYVKNPAWMEKYPYCDQLLKNIRKSGRIVTFPRAIVGQPPKKSRLIEDLNGRGWNYVQLTGNMKSLLHYSYAYATQFHLLAQNEKENFVGLIKSRFEKIQIVHNSIRNILQSLAKNLTNRSIAFPKQFQQIRKFNGIHNYMIMGSVANRRQGNQRLSLNVRFRALKELFHVNSKITHFQEWKQQHGQHNDAISRYYAFLKSCFVQQIDLLDSSLQIDETSRGQLQYLCIIVERILDEAVTFWYLNKDLVYKDGQINHELQNYIKEMVSLGSLFVSNLGQLDVQLIEEINNHIAPICSSSDFGRDYNYESINDCQFIAQLPLDQCEQLIAEVLNIKQAHIEMDSLTAYFIVYNLMLRKANFYGRLRQSDRLYALTQALFYTIKIQICYQIPSHLRELLKAQKTILTELLYFFIDNRQGRKALDICEALNQKQLKRLVLIRMFQMNKKDNEILKKLAQFCREIGYTDEAIGYYREYDRRSCANSQRIIQEIKQQYKNNSILQQKIIQEESYRPMDIQNLLKFINQFIAAFMPQKKPLTFNHQHEKRDYQHRTKNINAVQKIQAKLPVNPESFELLAYTNKIANMIEGKKCTIFLSPNSGTGQTTLAYLIAGHPLRANFRNNEFIYDLVGKNTNRINNHTQYPLILQPCGGEIIIDYVDLFGKPPLSLAAIIGLKRLLTAAQSLRFMLVIRDEEVADAQAEGLIKMLSFFINIFGIVDEQISLIKELAKALHVTLSFAPSVSVQGDRRKKLGSIVKKLNDSRMVAQNEKKYFLSKTSQRICHYLLKGLLGKIFIFQKPNRLNERYQKVPSAMNPNGNGLVPDVDKWSYLSNNETLTGMIRRVIKGQLQGQIDLSAQAIQTKQKKILIIYSELGLFTKARVQQFINKQQPDQPKFFEDLTEQLRIRQIQPSEQVPGNQVIRDLTIVRQIFTIRQKLQKCVSGERQDYYFEDISDIAVALFDCSKILCMSQAALIDSWKQATTALIQEIRLMIQNFKDCEREELLNRLSSIKVRINDQIIVSYQDEFNQVASALNLINFIPEIQTLQSLEDKEYALSLYKQIIDYIVSAQSMRPTNHQLQASLLHRRKELANAQIDVYSQLKRTQDLLRAQLSLIDMQVLQLQSSNKPIQQTHEAIYLLSQMAHQVRSEHPKIALKIGELLGNKQIMAYAYKYLEEQQTKINTKVEYLIILIDLSIQLKQRSLTTNILHKRLLSYVASNPQVQAMFKQLTKLQNYRRARIPVPQPRDPTAQEIKALIDSIKSDLAL